MLHRSFKPAKCKTALKMAVSRLKLLKNKREAHIKQLKRELAQLLEAGQDRTARIRVEHVVREEKTMAAYDLIDIYCELIVARLSIIESQKRCPIDLKEAIASVIFASVRCADVPELMDARKHFTAKYGKEFTSSALEVRPDCGVSRLLIEKLSAVAPDGPTKIKILSAIAEEHNIKWEPKSFGEKDLNPPEDLLNGPNTFEKVNIMHADPPNARDKGSPNAQVPSHIHVPPQSYGSHDVPVNFNSHIGIHSPSFASSDMSVNNATSSGAYHPDVRPSDTLVTEGLEFKHSYPGDLRVSSSGRQNWNMAFKDATAAAQAAAESAERASMAARAAAELSSQEKIIRQYSTESRISSPYGFRDEDPQKYGGLTLQSEHVARDSINNPLGRNSRMQYEEIDNSRHDNLAGEAAKPDRDGVENKDKSHQSASFESTNDEPLVNNPQMAGRYSRKHSSESSNGRQSDIFCEVGGIQTQSSESVAALQRKDTDYLEEGRIRKQSSRVSSHSGSSTFNDDIVSDFKPQRLESDFGENPFSASDMENLQRSTKEAESYDHDEVVFDDSDSDDGELKFDSGTEQKEQEYGFDLSSPGRKSPTRQFTGLNAWSYRDNPKMSQVKSRSQPGIFKDQNPSSVFSDDSTSSIVPSRGDDLLPVAFDQSNGSSSESEEELEKSEIAGSSDHGISRTSKMSEVRGQWSRESSFAEKGNVGCSKPLLQPSLEDSRTVEVHPDRTEGIELTTGSAGRFGYGEVDSSHLSTRFSKSKLDLDDIDRNSLNGSVYEEKQEQSHRPSRFSEIQETKDNAFTIMSDETLKDSKEIKESSLGSGKELNLGILTGGLRNKGYRPPLYTKSSSGNASSFKQEAEDAYTKIEQSYSPTIKPSLTYGTHDQGIYTDKASAESNKTPNTRTPVQYVASTDDFSEDERYNRKMYIEESKKSSSKVPVPYFHSSDSESEEEFPKKTSTVNARQNAGFSRRTKVIHRNSGSSSYLKATVPSEPSLTPDYGAERDSSSRSSYATETRLKAQSQNKSFDHWESSEQSRLADQAASKSISESWRSSQDGSLKSSAKELPSNSLKAKEQSSNFLSNSATSSRNESASSKGIPSMEKASHVHPKLPDYDMLTAHLHSLRSKHQ